MTHEAKAHDDPLPLARYAEICAEIDAGATQKPLLEREAIAPELWARSQAHWLKRMAAEVELRRFPITTKYQAIFKAKRAVATARLKVARGERARAAEPALGPVEAAAAELARPVAAPLPDVVAPSPPITAPPPAAPATITAPPPPLPAVSSVDAAMAAPRIAAPPVAPLPAPPLPATAPAPPPRVAPPAIVARSPAAAGRDDDDDDGDKATGKTGIVDISDLLRKHVMPFQAADDDDDEAPRTGLIDAAALLGSRATPFGRPATDEPLRADADPRVASTTPFRPGAEPAMPPRGPVTRVDLGSTVMHATSPFAAAPLPFTQERPPASPSAPGAPSAPAPHPMPPRTPSSPGMQSVPAAAPSSPGVPALAARAPSSPGMPAVAVPTSHVPSSGAESKKLTLAAFASLTAELAEDPGTVDAIRKKYGVTEQEHQETSRTFTHAFQQDDVLRQRYVAMVHQYRGYLQRAKR